ncbi:MAG: hypothetical protein PSV46_04980, partial [Reyranella sp.]|nr:hypothetical protein [Reyranella sp.]
TKLGQEVLSLGKFKANERYLRSLVDFLVGKGFTCELGKTGVTPEGRRALIPPWETIKPPDKAGQ